MKKETTKVRISFDIEVYHYTEEALDSAIQNIEEHFNTRRNKTSVTSSEGFYWELANNIKVEKEYELERKS